MVIAGGNLPSETRTPYHKPDRPQQLFVDFRIDFINKMLIIGLTNEREPEESAMSELGIYEGCYALLRNGEIVGPISKDHATSSDYIWDGPEGTSWTAAGTVWISSFCDRDIVRVGPRELLKVTEMEASEQPHWDMCATIPPHVTKAAMDAGIKADPAYEQFVNAILTAGFKAQYGIGFVPVTEQAPISVTDELLEQMASVFGDKGFYELGDTAQQKLRGAAECAVAFFGGNQVVPKNESENRIPDSEKTKGGLSAIPSLREIHDEVLAEVRDWHAKYGRDSMPSTFSIAKAFHRMLTPVADGEPSNPFDALETMDYKSTNE
ncbi:MULTISPECIES: hypothetical protein [unclassified Agrobacterium]